MFSSVRHHFSPGERNVHKNYPVESMHFPTFFRDSEFEKIRWKAFSGVLPFIVVQLTYGKQHLQPFSAFEPYVHWNFSVESMHFPVFSATVNSCKGCIFPRLPPLGESLFRQISLPGLNRTADSQSTLSYFPPPNRINASLIILIKFIDA